MFPPAADVVQAGGQVDGASWAAAAEFFRLPVHNQVRIEQRTTVRIAPRAAPPPPNMFIDLPRDAREDAPRLVERRFGRCMPISAIAGVQYGGGNRLLLFMRDRRLVSAELEKACRARDFYSGFYIDRTEDGQLCVDRDMLHSRAGANCSVRRLRQLVDADD